MTDSIAARLVDTTRYPLTAEAGSQWQTTFARQRYVHLQGFYQGASLALLQCEVRRLAEQAQRRDFNMTETHETPRLLSTLNGNAIDAASCLVPALYYDKTLLAFMSAITGESLYQVSDPGENYVLNILHQEGDTHGAHVDTYAYTLITAIEMPEQGAGGCLELVPGVNEPAAMEGPDVVHLCAQPGDCILLDAANSIHRVTPLNRPSRRIVISSALANHVTQDGISYSSKKLYGDAVSA